MRLVSPGPKSTFSKELVRDAGLHPLVPCEKSRTVELCAFTVAAKRRSTSEMNLGQFASRPDTWPVAVDPINVSGSGHSRRTSNRFSKLDAQILRTASHWEVWIFRRGQRLHCAGSIGLALASDALRQGQDLVDDLLNDTLKQLERGSRLPLCASAKRRGERRRHPGPISSEPAHGNFSIATRPVGAKEKSA